MYYYSFFNIAIPNKRSLLALKNKTSTIFIFTLLLLVWTFWREKNCLLKWYFEFKQMNNIVHKLRNLLTTLNKTDATLPQHCYRSVASMQSDNDIIVAILQVLEYNTSTLNYFGTNKNLCQITIL